MRRAAKVDGNHAEIVKALRKANCGVLDLSAVGKGCPDLLVHSPVGEWGEMPFMVLLEVKDGSKPPSARKLTAQQIEFHAMWEGPIRIVTSPEQALKVMGIVV